MAENNASAASATAFKSGMSQFDVEFLIACLKNTSGGNITVDIKAVAKALDYQNVRSVSNRVSALKKKFDLPIGTSSNGDGTVPAKSKKGSGSPNKSAGPTTPSKNKVVKKRGPAKKTPRKKPAANPETEDEADEEVYSDQDADENLLADNEDEEEFHNA